MPRKNVWTLFLLSAGLTSVCSVPRVIHAAAPGLSPAGEFQETALGVVGGKAAAAFVKWQSPTGCHLAWVEPHDKVRVLLDGQAGADYDEIAKSSLVFSPDGKRLAYVARQGQQWLAVGDGHGGGAYEEIAKGSAQFSPDSQGLAYIARHGQKWLVVVDGKPGPEYDEVIKTAPLFAPRGHRLAYLARSGQKWLVVADGMAGPEYDAIVKGTPVFSPDGQRLAYAARKDKQWAAVVDGQEGPALDQFIKGTSTLGPAGVVYGTLLFSPDSKHVAYAAMRGNKGLVVLDGKEGPIYDSVLPDTLVFSADGAHFAYAVRQEGQCLVVADGKEQDACDGLGLQAGDLSRAASRRPPAIDNVAGDEGDSPERRAKQRLATAEETAIAQGKPLFSPDGKHLVYLAWRGAARFVVLDGKPGPEYELAEAPAFSPITQRLAYVAAKDGVRFVVCAGQRGPDCEDIGPLVFSPDGQHLAYTAQRGGVPFVVVDGKAGPPFESLISLVFSPDGKHVAYVGMKNRKTSVVVDGRPDREVDEVAKGAPVFSPDGQRMAYAAGAYVPGKERAWRVYLDGTEGPEYAGTGNIVFSADGKHLAYVAVGRDYKQVVVADGQTGPEHNRIVCGPVYRSDGALEYLALTRQDGEQVLSRVLKTGR